MLGAEEVVAAMSATGDAGLARLGSGSRSKKREVEVQYNTDPDSQGADHAMTDGSIAKSTAGYSTYIA